MRSRKSASRRPSIFRAFKSDHRGVTAVEFGLIAVPFLGLLLTIFQAGLSYVISEALQAAVQNAARNFYTGQAQEVGVTTASGFISNYVCPASGGTQLSALIDCSKLIVDVRTAPTGGSFANVDMQADFYQANSTPKFCPGGPNEIVIVRVIYPMPVFVPTISTTTGHDVTVVTTGTVSNVANNPGLKQLLLGTAVFQNEPYATAYVAPSGC